jgi:ArsR family transcriptional regulator, arsenate/arsenite/antimonite-responsive transcriptional repressor
MEPRAMQELLAITRALDNAHRLRILLSLRGGEVCLCQLIEVLELAPSTVSKHVDLLRQAGLVEMRKDGRWHYYRLAGRDASPAVRDALRWVTRALAEEQLILSDAARLAGVCQSPPEEWTACYTRS